MTILLQIDSFTDTPYRGNPAAVCLLDRPPSERWMQMIAAEMNLSETAFLVPQGEQRYHLRWFTPTVEVDLCGHATLAAAHFLRQQLGISQQVEFDTASGRLTATYDGEWIELDFPVLPVQPAAPNVDIISGLNVEPIFFGVSKHDSLVEVENESMVRQCQPDLNLIRRSGTRGVIITAVSQTGDYDFVSRFFVPGAGIDEDPVTGSAHCVLIPYWENKLGRTKLTGFQASARGGVVRGERIDDRVKLRGQAVTVIECRLQHPVE